MAEPETPPFLERLEEELGVKWSEQEKEKILKLADGTALDTNVREKL